MTQSAPVVQLAIAGESPDAVYPEAVAATEHAFRMLEQGLGDLLRRPETSVTPVGAD
ncbi:hypothetical protein QNO09_01725 [Streptomyces sp. 378]|uniref:hypothetical protein n=1 Tax=Streptomyces sp. 378 TaxID=3049412 RepID=UPI0024C25AA9|nr:hypothetical protein [Streptomyces sp. 378]MDK1342055.1 hypothetical protein [Streptomyces sp. 378]